MRTLHFPHKAHQTAPTRLVLLPGAFQAPEDLLQHGLVDTVRASGMAIDVTLVDLAIDTTADILDGAVLHRLHECITMPRTQSAQRLWLAGISIGGLIALRYAASHAEEIEGIWLLGPYPGNRILLNELRAAGGPRRWAESASAADDGEAFAWRWLAGRAHRPASPFIRLAWGEQDRFADGQRLMAETLPPDCAASVPGAHDWPAWKAMWQRFMDHAATLPDHVPQGAYRDA